MPVTDFGDVAARIAAGLSGIRACLVVSRDGLSLGAYPADGEPKGREVWDVLEQLGDLKRGFVEMGMELWVIARRGPYGSVVVASPDVKPGLVLDRIEANLIAAEQERTRQTADEPLPPPRPEVRRPRSPLHPEPRLDHVPDEDAEAASEPERVVAEPQPVVSDREPIETAIAAIRDVPPEVEAPTAPVVDLSRVPDPEPAQADEPVADPPTPLTPAPPDTEPAPEPAAEAFALAMENDRSVEHVPTFTPAAPPEPAVSEVYVAGIAPQEAPPPVPVPTPEPPPAAPEPPPKKRRRIRRKSGEVDRVALAREFGHLMRDEFGV